MSLQLIGLRSAHNILINNTNTPGSASLLLAEIKQWIKLYELYLFEEKINKIIFCNVVWFFINMDNILVLKDYKTVPDTIYEYGPTLKFGHIPLVIDNGLCV